MYEMFAEFLVHVYPATEILFNHWPSRILTKGVGFASVDGQGGLDCVSHISLKQMEALAGPRLRVFHLSKTTGDALVNMRNHVYEVFKNSYGSCAKKNRPLVTDLRGNSAVFFKQPQDLAVTVIPFHRLTGSRTD